MCSTHGKLYRLIQIISGFSHAIFVHRWTSVSPYRTVKLQTNTFALRSYIYMWFLAIILADVNYISCLLCVIGSLCLPQREQIFTTELHTNICIECSFYSVQQTQFEHMRQNASFTLIAIESIRSTTTWLPYHLYTHAYCECVVV